MLVLRVGRCERRTSLTGLCREFCDVLRIVSFMAETVPLAACAGNVTIWDTCGVST